MYEYMDIDMDLEMLMCLGEPFPLVPHHFEPATNAETVLQHRNRPTDFQV